MYFLSLREKITQNEHKKKKKQITMRTKAKKKQKNGVLATYQSFRQSDSIFNDSKNNK